MGASACPDFRFAKPAPLEKVRRQKVKASMKHQRTVYDDVDARDKERCVVTGKRGNKQNLDPIEKVHHHHILQRGRDRGPTETWNIATIYASVHTAIHENVLTIEGNADTPGWLRIGIKASAVEEVFGRRRVPPHVTVIAVEDWRAWLDQHAARTTRTWLKKVGGGK